MNTEIQPVYFSVRSANAGDEPLGYVEDAKRAVAVLQKEISTWHGYAAPPPLLIKAVKHGDSFVGVWRERHYQPVTGEIQITNNIF